MIYVPPDGPVPCDLAVVGEAPGRVECEEGRSFVGPSGKVLWGGHDLMVVMANRPRETCYVTNVCKEPIPDADWWRLSLAEREQHQKSLMAELGNVKPQLVLAFGRRAAMATVPDFGTMHADHGKPTLNVAGKFIAMALWHPAAYLRGNNEALGAIATDLAKVETLLMADGLAEIMSGGQPVLEPKPLEWVERIGFLKFDGERKTAKCLLCSSKEAAAYSGEGLTWKLCRKHAAEAAVWAESNVEALFEHREVEMRAAADAKRERVAKKMQGEFLERYGRRSQ